MRYFYALSFVLILASCGSQPVKEAQTTSFSINDIQQMQSLDELSGLYKTLKSELAGKTESSHPEGFATLKAAKAKILALTGDKLRKMLAASALGGEGATAGLVPLPELSSMESSFTNSAGIEQSEWLQTLAPLTEAKRKTTKTIANLSEQTKRPDISAEEKISSYENLHTLSGDKQWKLRQDEALNKIVDEVRQAAQSDTLDSSLQSKVDLIKSIRKDDTALVDEMIGVDAKIYAKRYFDSLAEGKADKAYDVLVTMSKTEDFPKLKSKLEPSSEQMAKLFIAQADDSVEKPENLYQSYRWYSQARGVREILGLPKSKPAKIGNLITQLDDKYDILKKNREEPAALAVLYAIHSFKPNQPGLRKTLNDQEITVQDIAVPKLSTTDFQSRYKDQDYGDVISSFITQYLFEHVPNDVRIVEREQYEAIQRERELKGENSILSSVDFLVSGSVLESKVDTTEARNKKMMRITVGKETVANPAYVTWLKMSSRERKKVDEPSETLQIDKKENISVGVTHHRKVGIFSVSYRLLEATSGKVIYPDAISLNKEYEDESSEGVEIGEVVVPFKQADLPSDVEILDVLAKEVATEIAKKLVEKLEKQDQKYLTSADTAASQNDCATEVESLANGMMILKLKSEDFLRYRARLEDRALACYN